MIQFEIVRNDITEEPSDLVLLKYAQVPYGIDFKVASILIGLGICSRKKLRPLPGKFVIVDSSESPIAPSRVMFVGTEAIIEFGYPEMRNFARRAIEAIVSDFPDVKHVTTTVHGVGYGLDAGESVQSLVKGFLEGAEFKGSSRDLKITFVERDERTFRIMSRAMSAMGVLPSEAAPATGALPAATALIKNYRLADYACGGTIVDAPPEGLELGTARRDAAQGSVGLELPAKEHVFVAVPYAEDFQDVYEFGIYNPVRQCGYICEKVDQTSFTGDILQRIRERIASAKFVVADLTGSRPNVYLEVGYAWGRDIPVIFIARDGEALHFDVKTHRCIYYRTIGRLARDLESLVRGVYGRGEIR